MRVCGLLLGTSTGLCTRNSAKHGARRTHKCVHAHFREADMGDHVLAYMRLRVSASWLLASSYTHGCVTPYAKVECACS